MGKGTIALFCTIIRSTILEIIFAGLFGSSLFRAEGNAKRATLAMILSSILNVILDPIFIYTLNLGMKGTALATVVSVLISCIIMAYWILIKKDNYLELTYKHFKLDLNIIKEIIGLAIPSTLETTVVSVLILLTNLMITRASNSVSVGVYTASMQVVQFIVF